MFDVASIEEMASVRAASPAAQFHYHNPVKSRSEIEAAYRKFDCRRFAADCPEEISKIFETLGRDKDIEIAVRFRLPASGAAVHDFSSKFGAEPDAAVDLLKQVTSLGFAAVLTFHPGSQCTATGPWSNYIRVSAEIAREAGVKLKALNVGGGFPSRYIGSKAPSLTDYFTAIQQSARDAYGPAMPQLECEPGRALVAPAYSLVTQVKLVRAATQELFLNDGLYGGLMEVTQAPDLHPFFRVIRKDAVHMPRQQNTFTVYGPTCDPLDRLPHALALPADIREGDYIEFGGVGAYGTATSTRFNGYGRFLTVRTQCGYTGSDALLH